MMADTKIYPSCCTAAFCGRTSCEGCPNKPTLDAFKAWVVANNAVKIDPIWSPNVYISTLGTGWGRVQADPKSS